MQAPQLLRELLEREVGEHISHLEKRHKELVSPDCSELGAVSLKSRQAVWRPFLRILMHAAWRRAALLCQLTSERTVCQRQRCVAAAVGHLHHRLLQARWPALV